MADIDIGHGSRIYVHRASRWNVRHMSAKQPTFFFLSGFTSEKGANTEVVRQGFASFILAPHQKSLSSHLIVH